METLSAAELLAALRDESRLAIFRLLVEAGPEGINPSAIGEQLGMAPATLSFHLAHLRPAGLIGGERESRFIRYSANYATMDDLIAFLASNCCGGALLPAADPADPTLRGPGRAAMAVGNLAFCEDDFPVAGGRCLPGQRHSQIHSARVDLGCSCTSRPSSKCLSPRCSCRSACIRGRSSLT
ncbi:metalloregulator ArsR/SmtB family transcription factor [Dechloromonas agitata]|uniref:Helix-turn-helix transcriptional regulator n=1 Tax=Dechloromonas agitata TaxID=73030 RepID=A0A930G2U8_9RHOO|nr:metalloregulator ArsR/SmtB family transcription factor [Dechloromonas agitata]MBF1166188.1 helix-turn-helix transcriptional regulator [Dechloromonas agitata]MDE1544165.1 metalloregulator ArsR/SmtB family transcription factor [Dechloromonas agitata]